MAKKMVRRKTILIFPIYGSTHYRSVFFLLSLGHFIIILQEWRIVVAIAAIVTVFSALSFILSLFAARKKNIVSLVYPTNLTKTKATTTTTHAQTFPIG